MSSALKVMGKLGTVGLAHPICSVSLSWSHRKLGSVAFASVCVCVCERRGELYTTWNEIGTHLTDIIHLASPITLLNCPMYNKVECHPTILWNRKHVEETWLPPGS